MTFSIVAADLDAGDWGVAVASKFVSVGAVVPWAKAGVGAVATQSWANTSFGPEGLALMTDGASAEDALGTLVDGDEGRADRQVGVVDAAGRKLTICRGLRAWRCASPISWISSPPRMASISGSALALPRGR